MASSVTSTSQRTTEPAAIRVAFDTCVLVDWHRKPTSKTKELGALAEIFQAKLSADKGRWYFIYLDAMRREIGGQLLDRLAKEAEIQDILPSFDETVSLSRLPMILPVTIAGREHREAVKAFLSMSVSKSDSIVLADAVYIRSRFLVTTDMRIVRNDHAVRQAQRRYDLAILSPTEFLKFTNRGSATFSQ